MAKEIELKLSIESQHLPRLRRYLTTIDSGAKPITRKLTTIYYDTPALSLLNAGISLRIRRASGHWLQSIKSAGTSSAGLHQRMEWESNIASNQPDFSKISNPKLADLLSTQEIRCALKPIFKTVVQRSEYQLVFNKKDHIELAIDKGALIIDEMQTPISEVELELKSGDIWSLFNLALEIQQVVPITIENHSKAELGYRHYRTFNFQSQHAQPLLLNKNMQSFDAFKQIAWECMHHLQSNHDAVFHNADVEGVHQMRVAIRRLRSAFSVFKAMIDKGLAEPILAELKWLARTLGKARDLDVLILEILPSIATQSNHVKTLNKLLDVARISQTQAYSEVHDVLASQRYQCLILTISAWLESTQWHLNTHKSKPPKILTLATKTLSKQHHQLLKCGRDLAQMNAEERHVVRIYAKKLRYSTEFFSGLYNKKAQPFIDKLSKLQDILGSLNDISSTEVLIHNLTSNEKVIEEGLAIFQERNTVIIRQQLKKINKAWYQFSNQKSFW
jgi:triphosphatase